MGLLEWLEIASVDRIVSLALEQALLWLSVFNFLKGEKGNAIYLLCVCILLSLPR
jgi:hypothetical protein